MVGLHSTCGGEVYHMGGTPRWLEYHVPTDPFRLVRKIAIDVISFIQH